MHKYEFPWSLEFVAWATGGGAILASIFTIQPWWALLLGAVGFDLLCGFLAAVRSRDLTITTVENRVLTNAMILAVSKFFYMLSESAHHFKDVHGALVNPISELYPFGDWVAWASLAFITRSVLAHAAAFGYTLPFVSDWVERMSRAKPTFPPSNENLAKRGPLTEG